MILAFEDMSGLGTSESFMHHPASDRYWLKVAAGDQFDSVGFGGNASALVLALHIRVYFKREVNAT